MKLKIELDLTPKEAEELFIPSDKQTEVMGMLYDAYTAAIRETVWKHIDPHDMMGYRKHK